MSEPARMGLSSAEARACLERDGPNETVADQKGGLIATISEVVREPMLLMLVSAGLLYVFIGEAIDASLLLVSVVVVISITVIQERRTHRALNALRDLASPTSVVIRDGTQVRIPSATLVQGDVLLLSEGDRVPADAKLIEATNLRVDESLLTGGSVPVSKFGPTPDRRDSHGGSINADTSRVTQAPPTSADPRHHVHGGTLVTTGHAVAEVTATGSHSGLGQIGVSLVAITDQPTRLRQETARIVRVLAIWGIGACVTVAVWYALTRGATLVSVRDGILAGIAMAMGILPEENPVVLTVFLAIGAWRISRSNVLTRRMPAIEMLGAATVLCVDKTGTLTRNQMSVRILETMDYRTDLTLARGVVEPEPLHRLLEDAILASRPGSLDPMDRALEFVGADLLSGTEHLPLTGPLLGNTRLPKSCWLLATHGRQAMGRIDSPWFPKVHRKRSSTSVTLKKTQQRRSSVARKNWPSPGYGSSRLPGQRRAVTDLPQLHTTCRLRSLASWALTTPCVMA